MTNTEQLPPASQALDYICRAVHESRKTLYVFLDYDGTLTPIVNRPEEAYLPPATEVVIRRLSRSCKLAIITGRSYEQIRAFVKLSGIYFAASHGFDMRGCGSDPFTVQPASDFLPAIDEARRMLKLKLAGIEGCLVEYNPFSVPVHYRLCADSDVEQVKNMVLEISQQYCDRLVLTEGKKVLELRPRFEWHKGKALTWLFERFGASKEDSICIFIGDDKTDEDALRSLPQGSVGILVSEEHRPTAATHVLKNPSEVCMFLDELDKRLKLGPPY